MSTYSARVFFEKKWGLFNSGPRKINIKELGAHELCQQSTLLQTGLPLAQYLREVLEFLGEETELGRSSSGLVHKVATVSVGTVSFVEETETWLRLVWSVLDSVAAQLLGPMSELTPLSIRTGSSQHKVFAEGALNFGGFEASLFVSVWLREGEWGEFLFLGLSIRFWLVGRACGVREERSLLVYYHFTQWLLSGLFIRWLL